MYLSSNVLRFMGSREDKNILANSRVELPVSKTTFQKPLVCQLWVVEVGMHTVTSCGGVPTRRVTLSVLRWDTTKEHEPVMLPNHLYSRRVKDRKEVNLVTHCKSVPLKKSARGMFSGDKALRFNDFPAGATREERVIF